MIPKFDHIITFDSIDSTNSYLKENHHNHSNGTVIFTKEQLNGRGRYDRVWEGGKNRSIFGSFLIKDISDPLDGIRMTFLFSLAVGDFLRNVFKLKGFDYKWPNDILINNRKVCGILSEFSNRSLIIGVGINIFKFNNSKEIEPIVDFVENYSNLTETIELYRLKFVESVNKIVNNFKEEKLEKIPYIWFNESGIKGRKVIVTDDNGSKLSGIASDIEDSGVLKLIVDGDLKRIHTGDMFYND